MKLLQMPARISVVVNACGEDSPEFRKNPNEGELGELIAPDIGASRVRGEIKEDYNPWATYRNHTVVLLRKYFRMSLELGRMPSLLGGELFRAKVTAYRVHTFEDSVIFVHDMEQCLSKLDALSRLLIARIYFQEFNHDEVAAELRITRRQVINRMFDALDRTSEILVERELLDIPYVLEGLGKKPPRSVREVIEGSSLDSAIGDS